MVFLVVDINNYDLCLRLDILMKIGTMVDVENEVIQVSNGLGVAVELLPFNVVNMLQKIVETTYASVRNMNNNFNNIQLEEKFLKGAKIVLLQSIHPSFEDCDDDYVSKEGLHES
jgi:hypothetical protein